MVIKFVDGIVAQIETINIINPNVVEVVGTQANTSGFYVSRDKYKDDWDFTLYTTIYKVTDNSIMYSKDGSKWSDQTIDVNVSILWDDDDNREAYRPSEVLVLVDGVGVVLNDKNNWHKTYCDIPIDSKMIVVYPDIYGYETINQGYFATYKHDCIPKPSIEERLDDVESAVLELYEIVED